MSILRIPLVLAILAVTPAVAETLEDAWRLATARDPGLAAAASLAAAGQAGERAARAERWPRVTVDGSYQRIDDAPSFSFPVGDGTFTSPELVNGDEVLMARARLEMPLFTAGRVTSGIESAAAAARGADLGRQDYEQDLRLRVATAYVDVLRAERALRAAEASAASLAAHADDVAVMVERESVARNDLLAARVTQADADQARLQAGNRHALAMAAYNRLLGEPLDRVPDLADVPAVPPPAGSLEELVARALAGRRDLAGLDARARALAGQADSERAARWPQVGLLADYQHLDNAVLDDDDFALVGVGVSWTVFDAGRIRQKANALASASRAAADNRQELASRVALEVRQAWLDLQEAEARVAVTRGAVEQADENLRVGRELYGVGLATNTVVLDAEALWLRATGNQDNAVLDVALAALRLKRALGEL